MWIAHNTGRDSVTLQVRMLMQVNRAIRHTLSPDVLAYMSISGKKCNTEGNTLHKAYM